MGDKIPAISSKELIKVLIQWGFEFIRQSGTSHAIYKNFKIKRMVSVPRHGKTILRRGTLKAILKGSGKTLEDLKKELNK